MALHFAREVFVPIALAILFAFLLSPLIMRLRRLGWPKIPAIIAVVATAFGLIAVIGGLVAFQLLDLAQSLPEYKENIQAKMKVLALSTGGKLSKLIDTFEVAKSDQPLETAINDSPNEKRKSHEPKPIAVEMHEPAPTTLKVARGVLGNLFTPLLTAGIVVVLVLFMLVQREDLRNRVLRLLGSGKLNVSTRALDDAAQRVSRYLLMQLTVNACFGVLIGLGLYLIGIPNALVWGILATLLRFIPYVGSVLASVFPIGLAFAVDPGWVKPVLTVILFASSEFLNGNLIEPWLYGATTGISSFAVIIATLFWTWLWGPIGLLLATPITVCIAVLGRYVPNLQFLHVILSDEPVLSEEMRFYQRLLANDAEEAAEVAEETLKAHSLEFVYDRVIMPALSLAEHDRNEGLLDVQRFKFIVDSTRQIVADFDTPEQDELPQNGRGADRRSPISVLCIPAKDEADEICGMMLAQLLRLKNVLARAVSASSLVNERLEEVRRAAVPVICVSALPPSALRQARLFCKRLRSEFPELRIVVGVWTRSPDLERIHSRLPSDLVSQVVTNLAEAVEIIRPLAGSQSGAVTSSIPNNERHLIEAQSYESI